MKHLETFNESMATKIPVRIKKICEKYGITNYTIVDGKVNVKGSVIMQGQKLKKIPLIFGEVTGNFNCGSNFLTSLEGCPDIVGHSFYCYNNGLTTLEGSPKIVGGSFYCSDNKLISLKGGPIKVSGRFSCKRNKLTSLEGAPKEVEGYFDCSDNELISLEGAPTKTGGNKKSERFSRNPVSEGTLSMLFDIMETDKITYNEAVKLLITEIPAEDLGVMDLPGIDMSPEVLRMIKSYSRIKGML
jgi:hypothetical protein